MLVWQREGGGALPDQNSRVKIIVGNGTFYGLFVGWFLFFVLFFFFCFVFWWVCLFVCLPFREQKWWIKDTLPMVSNVILPTKCQILKSAAGDNLSCQPKVYN